MGEPWTQGGSSQSSVGSANLRELNLAYLEMNLFRKAAAVIVGSVVTDAP